MAILRRIHRVILQGFSSFLYNSEHKANFVSSFLTIHPPQFLSFLLSYISLTVVATIVRHISTNTHCPMRDTWPILPANGEYQRQWVLGSLLSLNDACVLLSNNREWTIHKTLKQTLSLAACQRPAAALHN